MSNTGPKIYTIRDLADEFDVTARAIRFYESKDLIHPDRVRGQRIFSARDRARLALILRGKRFGFSLLEIKSLLDLYDLEDDQTEQMRITLLAARKRMSALERQRDDITQTLEELEMGCSHIENALKSKGIDPNALDDLDPSDAEQFTMSGSGPIVKSQSGTRH